MMTACSGKKLFCIFFSVVMMISGMCFAGSAADSAVVCSPEGNVSSELLVSPAFFWDSHSNAEELSGISGADASVEGIECSWDEMKARGGLSVLSAAVLPDNFQYYLKMLMLTAVCHTGCRSTIIRYIHHQDGLKDYEYGIHRQNL